MGDTLIVHIFREIIYEHRYDNFSEVCWRWYSDMMVKSLSQLRTAKAMDNEMLECTVS